MSATEDSPGCEACFPSSPESAWEARAKLEFVADLVDESHFHAMVLACRGCGQRFVSVFTETIDWTDGDDPQYWQLLPITAEEAERICRIEPTRSALEALGPGRRSLRVDHPKGGPEQSYWSLGINVGYHD